MQEKIPFYHAKRYEALKMSLAALLGTILSVSALGLFFLFVEDAPPYNNVLNTVWWLFLTMAVTGFSGGLSFYHAKYTKLPIVGAVLGFLTGLLSIAFTSEMDLFLRVLSALALGMLFAAISAFIIWVDPQAYSE